MQKETDLPNYKDRMEIIQTARKEYEKVIAERIIHHALHKKVPPSAHFRYIPGQSVYVYRENLINKFT